MVLRLLQNFANERGRTGTLNAANSWSSTNEKISGAYYPNRHGRRVCKDFEIHYWLTANYGTNVKTCWSVKSSGPASYLSLSGLNLNSIVWSLFVHPRQSRHNVFHSRGYEVASKGFWDPSISFLFSIFLFLFCWLHYPILPSGSVPERRGSGLLNIPLKYK